ncbi:MAG: hypothetical protein OXH57_06430 [Ekhidna sp.]|nr:hypothetical protein [Ekhidna sp.]
MDIKNNFTDPNELENKIFKTFESLAKEYFGWEKEEKTNTNITKEIKHRIGEVLKGHGFLVSSSEHDAEWLFDLVAYTNNDEGYLRTVELALESELSARKERDLKVDFEKLLAANCEQKIMICFAEGNFNHPSSVNNIIDHFDRFIKSFRAHAPNSRYLILIWDDYTTGDVYPHLITT